MMKFIENIPTSTVVWLLVVSIGFLFLMLLGGLLP